MSSSWAWSAIALVPTVAAVALFVALRRSRRIAAERSTVARINDRDDRGERQALREVQVGSAEVRDVIRRRGIARADGRSRRPGLGRRS